MAGIEVVLEIVEKRPDQEASGVERLVMPGCKCEMRTTLVGDGCEKCNPELHLKLVTERMEEAEEKLTKIKQWCDAYPLDVFPEPNFKEATRVLKESGMTIDAISASNMRHVLEGVKRIISA